MVDSVNGNNYSYTIKRGDNLTRIARANNTTIDAILKINPQIKNPDKIYTGKTLILPNNSKFVQKEDYSPNNMNMSSITVNGQEIEQLGGKDLKSNFYANNLGALSETSMQDDNPATKITVQMQPGKSMTRKDNDTPYSILNKVLGDHLDNNSKVVTDENGKLKAQSTRLEDTDLYKAFISEDVNGDNFTGEDNRLLARGESGNNVQLPSVEVDSNNTKYFTLHGKGDEILYFDATGKQVEFENGLIKGATEPQAQPQPEIQNGTYSAAPDNTEFAMRADNNDKTLNTGTFYINGKPVENPPELKSNFYANNINEFMNETLNDDNKATRLDIQLNMGSQISERDTKANDILKKILGNNFDTQSKTKLQDSDLYKAFVSAEVNGTNFTDNKLTRNENGVNVVQFPALEADANGVKYYTLHTSEGKILYFNDKGEQIKNGEGGI